MFSYLRRDHRRASASPTSTSTPPSASSVYSSSTWREQAGDALPPFLPSFTFSASSNRTTFESIEPTTRPEALLMRDLGSPANNATLSFSPQAISSPGYSTKFGSAQALSNGSASRSSPEDQTTTPSPAPVYQSNHSQQPSSADPTQGNLVSSDRHQNTSTSNCRMPIDKPAVNVPSSPVDGHTRPPKHGGSPKILSKDQPRAEGGFQNRILGHSRDNAVEKVPGGRRQSPSVERDSSHDIPLSRSGRAKFHLLNPMSLLARRRSSQGTSSRATEASIRAHDLVPIPDDYDPRIRGSIVHDFSAPRPRGNHSITPTLRHDDRNPAASPVVSQTEESLDRRSQIAAPSKSRNGHSPAFREHFNDDQMVLHVGNKGYLQSDLLMGNGYNGKNDRYVPVFARGLPSTLPEDGEGALAQSLETEGNSTPVAGADTGSQLPDVVEQPNHQPVGLPQHLKSTASRFSFDMNGVGSSTQEKLLEERHKQKEAERKAQTQQNGTEFSDLDDDFDADPVDDLDDVEERIPGVNVEADGDEGDHGGGFAGFTGPGLAVKTSALFVPSLSPVLSSPISPAALNGEERPGIEVDAQHDSTDLKPDRSYSPSLYDDSTPEDGCPDPQQQVKVIVKSPPAPAQSFVDTDVVSHSRLSELDADDDDDDDLYFDDGNFGDLSVVTDGDRIDESIFDDANAFAHGQKQLPVTVVPNFDEGGVECIDENARWDVHSPLHHQVLHPVAGFPASDKVPDGCQNEGKFKEPGLPNGVLSKHNLEVFNNALAKLATEAAAHGTRRTASGSEQCSGEEDASLSYAPQHAAISPLNEFHQGMDATGFDALADEDFNYYDDEEYGCYDDPIIAAANAEALENDDEGIYGQEFGFYAQAHSTCNSELVNGGYFGPRSVRGVSHSFSGQGKFCEPSLTPITERSEWSTRNSIVSLATHGVAHLNGSNGSGPGLAQLVDMDDLEDEDMSLDALMRLRRGAFGGSNGSLRSRSSSPPATQQLPVYASPHSAVPAGAESAAGPSQSQDTTATDFGQATSAGASNPANAPSRSSKAHSRTSSAASISYTLETEEDGSRKWVLERRRMSVDGEVEVLEREVLPPSQI